ncbi:hypothetical protein CIL05_01695 [Virgibacillus profundi]|uniref:DUF1934 domain-containing protein n=1 Tax=Virgibacillus profundi TaxID=2024555 RepID=A0A2A2IJF4_9BACI|nr:DUF1934 domain-containing protein [Virgibacillus profundi]PAV31394.1 hypothetical protein CIL05_01695 [Virgibacillus profundi]PXY55580.1 DUF1934 domain-containing protein [Virgibacillus profundi]
MDTYKKSVAIELRTTIDDNGQMEYNTIKQSGDFYKKNHLDVLTYEEKMEDNSTIKNLITIQTDRVSIKRSGNVTMNQKFRKNHTTENVFQHPHGNIHMETYTNSISYQSMNENDQGKLTISYTVKLNGQEERKHELVLTYTEEGA